MMKIQQMKMKLLYLGLKKIPLVAAHAQIFSNFIFMLTIVTMRAFYM